MHPSRQAHLTAVIAALALASAPGIAGERRSLPSIVAFPNASGVAATYSTKGSIDLANPFFPSAWHQRPLVCDLPCAG